MPLLTLFDCYLQELCYWLVEQSVEFCPEIFSYLKVS